MTLHTLNYSQAGESARVYLVGAGPGDPELLTMKAARLLRQADVVLHDALVDPRVLQIASNARLIDVGKRASKSSTAQRFINRMLVTSARNHSCVVRLKGGDPTIFGRLDEEMQALRDAGIAFEVVPGVTAACAAAATLQASLTLRGVARSVRFLTPRVAADRVLRHGRGTAVGDRRRDAGGVHGRRNAGPTRATPGRRRKACLDSARRGGECVASNRAALGGHARHCTDLAGSAGGWTGSAADRAGPRQRCTPTRCVAHRSGVPRRSGGRIADFVATVA